MGPMPESIPTSLEDLTVLAPMLIEYASSVFFALLILIVGLIVAGLMSRRVVRFAESRNVDPTLSRFFGQVLRYTLVILSILTALTACGIETTSFAAVLGATGLAVGLALQGTLGNVAAGTMLILFRPFRAGQYVEVGGKAGTVEAISLFAVTLVTPDNREITVPNGQVFGNVIENFSARDTRRVQITVGLDYAADPDRTREVLLQVVRNYQPRLDDPEPAVVCAGLGASSVDWHCRVWVASSEFWPCMDRLTVDIKKGLDAAGIGIPFPQMDVHLDGSARLESPPSRAA
jgi:small conductance mechanosensitive channel